MRYTDWRYVGPGLAIGVLTVVAMAVPTVGTGPTGSVGATDLTAVVAGSFGMAAVAGSWALLGAYEGRRL